MPLVTEKRILHNNNNPLSIINISILLCRGIGRSFFPVKHEKFPPSYIQDAKNFSVVKPLNSGEAVASLASPVPPPLFILDKLAFSFNLVIEYDQGRRNR